MKPLGEGRWGRSGGRRPRPKEPRPLVPRDRHTPAAVLTLSRRPAQERLGRGWVTQRRPVARGRAGTDRAGTGPSSRAPRASHSPTTRQREPPSAPESLPGNGRPRERLRPASASNPHPLGAGKSAPPFPLPGALAPPAAAAGSAARPGGKGPRCEP